MRQLLTKSYIAAFALLAFVFSALSGCTDDDLTASNGNSLSTAVEEMNYNLKALKALLDAKTDNKGIKECTLVSDKTYNVELEDGSSVTVRTAIPSIGEDEKAVYVPLVSVSEYGGTYYWTLDGDFLTHGGQKIPADGTDTPFIGIDDNNNWTLTLGNTVRTLSAVENGTVKSLFSDVVTTGELSVKFLLRGSLPVLSLKRTTPGTDPIPPTGTLRRIIDPDHPAWFVHIDAWNSPDPQAIINLIPEDVRPYVVFNISFSVSKNETTGGFVRPADGYNTAKSWLSVCARNKVWAMVQASSGGDCHWPDFENYNELSGSLFEEFFQKYPNFIGFNYAEQGWGFKSDAAFITRLKHFANLLKLCNEYGGYLTVSYFNPSYGAGCNGVAMLKRCAEFSDACLKYPVNFIPCEKFTQENSFLEMESTSLGVFLSGHAANYGIRFDECGWLGGEKTIRFWNDEREFPPAAGTIPVIEHIMLTGETVMDGPELIWKQCFKEGSAVGTSDGYKSRSWQCYDQFNNISLDIYRKILDGTIRIMDRKEVIDRTKLVIVNDIIPTGAVMFDPGYAAPATLYRGLYLMDEDGIQTDNRFWFKKTGRYPAVPVVAKLGDDLARTFPYQINASQFRSSAGWGDIAFKQRKFNEIFPAEYTSNGMFAARHENGWVIYNCYADTRTASIPFKYNTCDRMKLEFGKYSVAVVKEHAGCVDFYLSNYTNNRKDITDRIQIYGSTKRPTFTFKNRVAGNSCSVSEEWKNGVLTLTVRHNGPLDLSVVCAGEGTGRLISLRTANVMQPAAPDEYNGLCQYEAETFEYKNISKIQSNAALVSGTLTGFVGMGYLEFGTNSDAAVRQTVSVNEDGRYAVRVRYCSPSATVRTVVLRVDGVDISSPEFTVTGGGNSSWNTVSVPVSLKKGKNRIELKATDSPAGELYFDYIIIEKI